MYFQDVNYLNVVSNVINSTQIKCVSEYYITVFSVVFVFNKLLRASEGKLGLVGVLTAGSFVPKISFLKDYKGKAI